MSTWSRREFVTSVGLASATLGLGARAAAAPSHSGSGRIPAGLSASEEACLEDCLSCEQTCLATLQHCLTAGGDHLHGDHLQAMMACAQVCKVSAALITARSPLSEKQCEVCEAACDACAKSCEQAPADAQMQACIEACKVCATRCRDMAG
ncbi:MAG TPA: four-helix bundle copper-binding protein [Myxococcota bacterium]|nr:four-helix bundle copper-binding protein [Myxococcota bacterium]